MSSSKANTIDAKLLKLSKSFAEINLAYVDNTDPLRFDYIQNLYKRLSGSEKHGNTELIDKTQASIDLYITRLADRRSDVATTLEKIEANFPQQMETAKSLFEQCQFRQVEQLLNSAIKQQAADANVELLRQLTNGINSQAEEDEADPQSMSFDKILYQHELSARQLTGNTSGLPVDGSGEQLVMQSMKHFRQSMKHFNIDQVIARAINQGPENPGPLNPQMLAIKSLTQMRDLSPMYLRRFAAQIETLLWLEKNAAKLISTKLENN
jgi:hypothetical protein